MLWPVLVAVEVWYAAGHDRGPPVGAPHARGPGAHPGVPRPAVSLATTVAPVTTHTHVLPGLAQPQPQRARPLPRCRRATVFGNIEVGFSGRGPRHRRRPPGQGRHRHRCSTKPDVALSSLQPSTAELERGHPHRRSGARAALRRRAGARGAARRPRLAAAVAAPPPVVPARRPVHRGVVGRRPRHGDGHHPDVPAGPSRVVHRHRRPRHRPAEPGPCSPTSRPGRRRSTPTCATSSPSPPRSSRTTRRRLSTSPWPCACSSSRTSTTATSTR